MFVDYLEEGLIAYTHREFTDLEEFLIRFLLIIACSWLNIRVRLRCSRAALLRRKSCES
jgi:hypothetical protein